MGHLVQSYRDSEKLCNYRKGKIEGIKPHQSIYTLVHIESYIMTHVRPKKPVHHTVGILTGRKKTSFSYLCISVIPYLIGIKFAAELPAS